MIHFLQHSLNRLVQVSLLTVATMFMFGCVSETIEDNSSSSQNSSTQASEPDVSSVASSSSISAIASSQAASSAPTVSYGPAPTATEECVDAL